MTGCKNYILQKEVRDRALTGSAADWEGTCLSRDAERLLWFQLTNAIRQKAVHLQAALFFPEKEAEAMLQLPSQAGLSCVSNTLPPFMPSVSTATASEVYAGSASTTQADPACPGNDDTSKGMQNHATSWELPKKNCRSKNNQMSVLIIIKKKNTSSSSCHLSTCEVSNV